MRGRARVEGRGSRGESDLATLAILSTGAAYGVVLWAEAWGLGLSYITDWPPAAMLPAFLVIGAALWWLGLRRLVWSITGILTVVIAVVALTPVMRGPIHARIRRDPLPARVDAVVVLHGGSTADGLVGPATLDRVLGGVDLLRRGLATTAVVTEPHSPFSSERDELRLLGLAPAGTRVLVARDAYSTHDEAVKIAALARSLPGGLRSIALVTSPIHTSRACATFAKAGFAVTCVPAVDHGVSVRTLGEVRDRVLGFQQWLYETLGTVKYRHEGWL